MGQFIDPNDIHTAAATWSGFIYQGKIALYHILYLLNNDPNALEYNLQLDSLEDFAIVRKENNEIIPITLHQVKAMKSSLYSAYQEAFKKLEKRFKNYPCDGAYFHLATENEKTNVEIKGLHPLMNIYSAYDGNCNNYCSLDEVDDQCKMQISHFLENNNLDHLNNADNLVALRIRSEAIIFDQIIDIHSKNHNDNQSIREGAYQQIIPFLKISDNLKIDPQTLMNEDYYFFLTKELLNQSHCEFCFETIESLGEDNQEMTKDQKEKLSEYLQQINALSKTAILRFIQSLLPHKEIKLNSLIDFKNSNIEKDEFKEAFLQTLFELIRPKGKIGQNFIWNGNDNLKYAPTAINKGIASTNKLCKKIYRTIQDTNIEIPYESDKLITSDIDVTSLRDVLNLQNNIPEDGVDQKNNITKWSDVGLISLANAKEIIE